MPFVQQFGKPARSCPRTTSGSYNKKGKGVCGVATRPLLESATGTGNVSRDTREVKGSPLNESSRLSGSKEKVPGHWQSLLHLFQSLPLDALIHNFKQGDQVLVKKWRKDPLAESWQCNKSCHLKTPNSILGEGMLDKPPHDLV
ncbi:hypothetical protein Y1Q_0008847 [Alligator mississippiensis]|uniref:Murine leukemia virus integrase C-terminal domain-containing protein n=1 Tax=Alligator mississippiensis TaxID=8496 RepID=A0A151NAC0_ALLMI|nr:hypothetical protein Y1Q_0008847 [Alligator mississippiensis]